MPIPQLLALSKSGGNGNGGGNGSGGLNGNGKGGSPAVAGTRTLSSIGDAGEHLGVRTRWVLGLQAGAVRSRDGRTHLVLGHAGVGGSVAFCIPGTGLTTVFMRYADTCERLSVQDVKCMAVSLRA
eukprot:3858724-Pleurochrysis_carterae.AAC.1